MAITGNNQELELYIFIPQKSVHSKNQLPRYWPFQSCVGNWGELQIETNR